MTNLDEKVVSMDLYSKLERKANDLNINISNIYDFRNAYKDCSNTKDLKVIYTMLYTLDESQDLNSNSFSKKDFINVHGKSLLDTYGENTLVKALKLTNEIKKIKENYTEYQQYKMFSTEMFNVLHNVE